MTTTPVRPSDRVRQVVLIVCVVAAIIVAAIGSGAFGGTPIQDAAGGALSAHATRIAPAAPAFAVWSVIYLGLAAYAVRQLLPSQAANDRERQLGYAVTASLLLNALWILVVQAGWIWVSVVVIIFLLLVLGYAFTVCLRSPGGGWAEALLVDGVVGLYLGWVCVATAANIAAALVASGFDGWGLSADGWAVGVLAVTGLVGVALAVRGGGRLAPALSLCWGLVWVAVARLGGEPHSVPAAVAALVAAAVVAAATVVFRVVAARRDARIAAD